jgi:hypothetical protein
MKKSLSKLQYVINFLSLQIYFTDKQFVGVKVWLHLLIANIIN